MIDLLLALLALAVAVATNIRVHIAARRLDKLEHILDELEREP